MHTPYKPSDVGSKYAPRVAEFSKAGSKAGLTPAKQDKERIVLVMIDNQIDFVHTDGALSVPGAIDDTKRLLNWMYTNMGRITRIVASQDSHIQLQVFYPGWWTGASGGHPDPFTVITFEDVKNGLWRPAIDPVWTMEYLERLERDGKKNLMIWPYHTMIGTEGQALVPALAEAIAFHSAARWAQPQYLTKGTIPQVEHYGIFRPEVEFTRAPGGGTNTAVLDLIAQFDRIYVAGQAKSHCVLESMRQMLDYFGAGSDVVRKIYFLTDCTSSVQHPAIDFETIAKAELKKMAAQGVQMVKSTDPL